MKVKTKVKAGRLASNHNSKRLVVRTSIKAGRLASNHNRA